MEAVTEFLISVLYGAGFVFVIAALFFIIIGIFAGLEWLWDHHPIALSSLLFLPVFVVFLWLAGEIVRGKI